MKVVYQISGQWTVRLLRKLACRNMTWAHRSIIKTYCKFRGEGKKRSSSVIGRVNSEILSNLFRCIWLVKCFVTLILTVQCVCVYFPNEIKRFFIVFPWQPTHRDYLYPVINAFVYTCRTPKKSDCNAGICNFLMPSNLHHFKISQSVRVFLLYVYAHHIYPHQNMTFCIPLLGDVTGHMPFVYIELAAFPN